MVLLTGCGSSLALGWLPLEGVAAWRVVRISVTHRLHGSKRTSHFRIGVFFSRTVGQRGLDGSLARDLPLITPSSTVQLHIVVAGGMMGVKIVLVERCKITENVTDFFLLDEFTVVIL